MNSLNHLIEQAVRPSRDSLQWAAYLILKERYPTLKYWSYDGYHCDALVDYSIKRAWDGNRIVDTDSTMTSDWQVISLTEKPFRESNAAEICKMWLPLYGDSVDGFVKWADKFKDTK